MTPHKACASSASSNPSAAEDCLGAHATFTLELSCTTPGAHQGLSSLPLMLLQSKKNIANVDPNVTLWITIFNHLLSGSSVA
jgi:hypothetical protein